MVNHTNQNKGWRKYSHFHFLNKGYYSYYWEPFLMLGRDERKVIKILNRRQHTSQASTFDWKKNINMKTSLPLFGAPKLKGRIRTNNLSEIFTILKAINAVTI